MLDIRNYKDRVILYQSTQLLVPSNCNENNNRP